VGVVGGEDGRVEELSWKRENGMVVNECDEDY
jgi:hypothetical protein